MISITWQTEILPNDWKAGLFINNRNYFGRKQNDFYLWKNNLSDISALNMKNRVASVFV